MLLFSKRLLILLLISSAPICGFASEVYDLMDIYTLSLENDPTLKATKSAYDSALQYKPQARGALLPGISASGATTRSRSTLKTFPHFNVNQLTLSASQPIYHHDLWLELKTADLKIQQAQATLDAAHQDLMIRVAQYYFGVLAARDAWHFAKMQRIAFAKHLEQTQQRFNVGLIAITDVQEARARHDSAMAQELAAENAVADQLETLREIVGIPLHQLEPLKEKIPLVSPVPSKEEEWVTLSIAQNFSLAANRFDVELARRNILKQRVGHLPSIDLTAQIQNGTNAQTATPITMTDTTATLSITLPLFAGGAVISRTTQAKANFEQTQHHYDVNLRKAVSQTRQAYRGILTQISTVKALEQAVVSNQSALNATEAAYDVGTRTIVDVLDAQSNLLSAESDHAKARYDYLLNGLRLKLAAGTIQQDDLKLINSWLGAHIKD